MGRAETSDLLGQALADDSTAGAVFAGLEGLGRAYDGLREQGIDAAQAMGIVVGSVTTSLMKREAERA